MSKKQKSAGNPYYELFKGASIEELKLVSEVAHKTSEPEFIEFLKTGKVTGIKLSAHQMKLLSGGSWLSRRFMNATDAQEDYNFNHRDPNKTF